VNGANQTFVGYGPESLTKQPEFLPGVRPFAFDGGHFSLELSEVKSNAQVRGARALRGAWCSRLK
jgi:hypothetical protein